MPRARRNQTVLLKQHDLAMDPIVQLNDSHQTADTRHLLPYSEALVSSHQYTEQDQLSRWHIISMMQQHYRPLGIPIHARNLHSNAYLSILKDCRDILSRYIEITRCNGQASMEPRKEMRRHLHTIF